MKNKIIGALTLLLAISASAQSSKISDVATFKMRNASAIMDKNNNVDGYYFFYVGDKLKKGNREFTIQIMDQNLVEVARKNHVDNKNTFLMESSFNNQAMMFALANYKEKEITLLTFDKQANQTGMQKIPLESKEIRYIQAAEMTNSFTALYAVENKGFIFNKVDDNKKIGYTLKYYPTDGGAGWQFASPETAKDIKMITPIEVNSQVVVARDDSRPGALSRNITTTIKIIDVNTGKLMFERSYSKSKQPRMVTNAFLTPENTLVLMGEYYKQGDNIYDDKSLGLFSEVIDLTGKTVKESVASWETDIAKLLKVKEGSKVKDKGYIYFHDVIRTQTGEYYAIGEYYRKTVSAGGVAMALLVNSNSPVTQLTITNSVVFKFDKDFQLKSVHEFEKGKSRVPSMSDYGSPQLNAAAMAQLGYFDYSYTQIDPANDRFYSCFIDVEREKGEGSKPAFKTIIYDEGQLSEDKIPLKSIGKNFRVFPAKMGNVMLLEYDKKAKTLDLHLEKINIK